MLHLADRHGVEPEDAQYVVRHCLRPWPKAVQLGKFEVFGQTRSGRYLHVVFITDPDDTVFIIHARPMTEPEKRRYRRGQP